MRRGDDDAVGQSIAAAAIVDEDRVRDGRRRGVAVGGVHADVDAVRSQHPQRGLERGSGQGMRVAADEQRAVRPLARAIPADRLGRGGDVRLVERAVQRRAAMAGGPEGDPLGRIGRVGPDVVVGTNQAIDIHQFGRLGRPSGAFTDRHRASSRADRDTSGATIRCGGPIRCMDRAGYGVVQIERQATDQPTDRR